MLYFRKSILIHELTSSIPDDPDVARLHERYQRRVAARALASRPTMLRFATELKEKFIDQLYNYGKALENAGKAVISIARGITMEELLSEERLLDRRNNIAPSDVVDMT